MSNPPLSTQGKASRKGYQYNVSVIVPAHNAAQWIDAGFTSIKEQSWKDSLEVSIFDDASMDSTPEIIVKWIKEFEKVGIGVISCQNNSGCAGGVGFAKNQAIKQSSGEYLCFMDADDFMYPRRIELQLKMACENTDAIVGCSFHRLPTGSTERYTEWANSLSSSQLLTQAYTSFGPTVIQPTWFFHRNVYERSGPFDEIRKGFPEDLAFFYRHISKGGEVIRVEETLVMYRYHLSAATFSVHEDTIWGIRVRALEADILSKWDNFTIWNAGKQGRKLYRSLSAASRDKVVCFCDVDEKKIKKGFYKFENAPFGEQKRLVPIIHFSALTPPVVICVKLNLTSGQFEENLRSLGLTEGKDFYHFN